LGKSCHCAPVRKIQRTPLSTTRVSFHGVPSNGTLTSNGIDCDTVPLNSSTCNSLGIAVISLLLSATCVAQYQILPRRSPCAQWLPRLPRAANGLAVDAHHFGLTELDYGPYQGHKTCSNSSGSTAENTRLKVSCEGMPLGSRRNFFSQLRLAYRRNQYHSTSRPRTAQRLWQ
jgi:hypothetical protein